MAKSKGKWLALSLTIVATLAGYFLETCFAYVINQRPSLRLRRCTIGGREPSTTSLRMSTSQNEKDLKIVLYPDPVLRKKCNEVVNFDDNLRTLVRSMFNVMYESKGMGLAAPQVNISMRIIVWNALYEKKKENERVFINPSIVEPSLIRSKLVEGCLSFPDIEGKVDRPRVVSISYYDLDGNKHLKILKGIHARIFQHEYDHLDGILFIDRFSQSEKHKVRAKLNEMIRTYRSNNEGEPAI